MADPAFYSRDPQGFAKAAAELDAARERLAAMEEEWLELEMLREEIEG
jgi:ATP-binding cassette subfamily F protein uup